MADAIILWWMQRCFCGFLAFSEKVRLVKISSEIKAAKFGNFFLRSKLLIMNDLAGK